MPLEEKKKSRLYALKPLTDRLPAVTRPEGHVHFRTKMFWVLAILILYFAMTNIFIYGLDRANVIDFFSSLRAILAGPQGPLMHLGIGPIVTASIMVQLFAGSYLVFLMDEVVSKWGIGSGISLFIAGGVAQQIFTGTFNWEPSSATSQVPAGTIPKTVYYLQHYSGSQLASGGIEQIMVQPPNPLIALIGTVAIFLIVAYVESTRIELPLAHGMARGARGRYPIRLMYASNIPVILVAAVLANVSMFSLLFWQHPEWPLVGHASWIGAYPEATDSRVLNGQIQRTTPVGGLAYYFSNVNGVQDWLLPLFNPNSYGVYLRRLEYWQVFVHLLVFLGVFIGGSVMFAKFWIMTTNMGPEDVARQIESSGMQIPGFRRDPRILRRVLDRYIPVVAVISGASVGALAAGADMIGTVGNASGTGVLLSVGIMIQMYEAIGREQMMEMHPVLRQFFGATG